MRPAKEQVDAALSTADAESWDALNVLGAEVRALREQLLDLRETAVAFAYIAVTSDWTLRTTATLENLRRELNRCRPPNAAEMKPGWP